MWHLVILLSLITVSVGEVNEEEQSIESTESQQLQEENTEVESPMTREGDDELESKLDEHVIEVSRKKVKIKKKHKKFLKEILMVGLLIKSALLPLAVGFLKLLTGKAFLVTMMALGLVSVITFKGATEHKGSTTEIINLVGPHKHRRSRRSIPSNLPEEIAMEVLKIW